MIVYVVIENDADQLGSFSYPIGVYTTREQAEAQKDVPRYGYEIYEFNLDEDSDA